MEVLTINKYCFKMCVTVVLKKPLTVCLSDFTKTQTACVLCVYEIKLFHVCNSLTVLTTWLHIHRIWNGNFSLFCFYSNPVPCRRLIIRLLLNRRSFLLDFYLTIFFIIFYHWTATTGVTFDFTTFHLFIFKQN